jgi:type VI secretion system protein ImpI
MSELTLEVTGVQAAGLDQAGASRRFRFTASGGSIGRAQGGASHWTLPDGMVSSLHAVVSFEAGSFHIEDRKSTNGVKLNGVAIPVGVPHPLRDGDVLRIDPYTIRASIGASPRVALPSVDAALTSGQILEQFSGSWSPPPPPAEQPRLDQAIADHDFVATPLPVEAPRSGAAAASSSPIPRGYNPADSMFVTAEPPERPSVPVRATPPPSSPKSESPSPRPSKHHEAPVPTPQGAPPGPAARRDAALADLLAAAGIPDVPITPGLASEIGTILGIVAQGLVEVLKTRQEVKAEFDVEQTVPRLERNNPFKLARHGTQALEALFAKRHAAFLDPVDAFRDSFDDLRRHHVAMSAGIRAAFEAMLAEFSPDRLEQRFSRRSSGAILPLPAKVRHWDAYRERFDDLVNDDADEVFRRLFGDAFSEAYTSQLKSLKVRRGDDDA